MDILSIDVETYSSEDIKTSGAYKYCESEAFEILLFAYAFNDEPVEIIDITNYEVLPERVIKALADPSIIKSAFNANFERNAIYQFYGFPTPAENWECTMIKALTMGLPGSLDMVGKVLKFEEDKQKMKEGKALIQYFCKPCKPTKTNGGRTRNLPEHDPEKWETFKLYCKQDVEVERTIRNKLSRYTILPEEHKLWVLDQKINDRGINLDEELVKKAIECDENYSKKLEDEARKLTCLDNPNSPTQLKKWLSERVGYEVTSLTKDSIPGLLENAKDENVKRVLELRQLMAKTSIKKYEAMRAARGSKGRVRGLLQFYGANRTGRWAGRLVQVQNLPQNHLSDLELARNLVKSGDIETIEFLFGNVPDTLSQLIRTAFIPSDGNRFIVSDFSAIEARVIAWFAGEKWRLEVFKTHGKIYEASASQMFKVPIEGIKKGDPLRQKGKIAELACIAEGELVLTDVGLIPIENVKLSHKLWDGENWVQHEGVIFKGYKEVLKYDGLRATSDHIVWVEGESNPIKFEDAIKNSKHLRKTGNGRYPIWMGKNNKSLKALESKTKSLLCSNPMPRLRKSKVDRTKLFAKGNFKRVSALFTTEKNTKMVRSKINTSKAKMPESKRQKLFRIWWQRNRVQIWLYTGSWFMDNGECRKCNSRYGDGQNRHKWSLRKRKYKICNKRSKSSEPKINCFNKVESKRMAICKSSCNKEIKAGYDTRGNNRRSSTCCVGGEKELEKYTEKTKVYDIRNAGRNNRFTVSNCLVHNCGYGGGAGALKAMDKGGDIPEEHYLELISSWRAANPNITKFWWDVDKAAKKAIRERTTVCMQYGLKFIYEPGVLLIQLPSGRKLSYIRPKIESHETFSGDKITYEGMEQTSKQWTRLDTYGPKLVENIVQATARDCLREAMFRVENAGYHIVMHVHDELVLDIPKDKATIEEINSLMGQPITWAPGLPLKADGYECSYYMKD